MTNKESAKLAAQVLREMRNPSRFCVTTVQGQEYSGQIKQARRVNDTTVLDLIDPTSHVVRSFRLEDLTDLKKCG
jgi:hypothetical protein